MAPLSQLLLEVPAALPEEYPAFPLLYELIEPQETCEQYQH